MRRICTFFVWLTAVTGSSASGQEFRWARIEPEGEWMPPLSGARDICCRPLVFVRQLAAEHASPMAPELWLLPLPRQASVRKQIWFGGYSAPPALETVDISDLSGPRIAEPELPTGTTVRSLGMKQRPSKLLRVWLLKDERGEGRRPEFQTNVDARFTQRIDEAQQKYDLTGKGICVGIWDMGGVRTSHEELKPRAVQRDKPEKLDLHATHVAGTVGARGFNKAAKGMAPEVNISCYDHRADADEMRCAAKQAANTASIVCSNHSYAPLARGWFTWWDEHKKRQRWAWCGDQRLDQNEDCWFGCYDEHAARFDKLVYGNPHLSVFVAAGNDRNEAPDNQPNEHVFLPDPSQPSGKWAKSDRVRAPDGVRGGYDTVSHYAVSKNVITVGSIYELLGEPPQSSSIRLAKSSSWGPADDGRIKPDLVANGTTLYSLSHAGDEEYCKQSGTSMATPVATGTGALLAQLFSEKRNRLPFADEMKAVLIHTAISLYEGPSLQIGWGSIRADEAADVVADTKNQMYFLDRPVLSPRERKLVWEGTSTGEDVRVTVVWIDPPGIPRACPQLNDPTRALVNDLDLLLIDPSGGKHYPWTIAFNHRGPGPAEIPGRNGPNHVDNVERVDVKAPQGQKWQIVVSIEKLDAAQPFALVISGVSNVREVETSLLEDDGPI